MFKKLFFIAAIILAPVAAQAEMTPLVDMPFGEYKIDKTHASVTWKVSHMGLSNYTARFTKVDATLLFDAKDPAGSKLVATIDPTSVKTDYPNAAEKDFDAKLVTGEEWFNAGKFPEIKFESTAIKKTGESTGKVYGNLTFLGMTKPLTLDVVFNGAYLKKPLSQVPALGFSASGVMKRSDWGFSTYVPTIGDKVTILIEAEFHKAP